MKDRILDSYLNDFMSDNALPELESSKVFEHLVNYCIVAREHPENFDFEKVTVGSRDDLGVDGIAILVNEHLVTTKQEIDYFKTSLRRLDVQFFFIQSKTSEKFSHNFNFVRVLFEFRRSNNTDLQLLFRSRC